MTPSELKASIGRETDPKKLKQWIKNLEHLSDAVGVDIARRRLYAVLAGAEEGTLAHDVWRSIHSLEDALSDERGKTTRLGRTRQKIARVGELRTVADAAQSSKPSEGYYLLVERGLSDLLFEAVVKRHPNEFDEVTQAAAKRRLDALAAEPKR